MGLAARRLIDNIMAEKAGAFRRVRHCRGMATPWRRGGARRQRALWRQTQRIPTSCRARHDSVSVLSATTARDDGVAWRAQRFRGDAGVGDRRTRQAAGILLCLVRVISDRTRLFVRALAPARKYKLFLFSVGQKKDGRRTDDSQARITMNVCLHLAWRAGKGGIPSTRESRREGGDAATRWQATCPAPPTFPPPQHEKALATGAPGACILADRRSAGTPPHTRAVAGLRYSNNPHPRPHYGVIAIVRAAATRATNHILLW